MKAIVQKQIGKAVLKFEVDEPKTTDALLEIGFLAQTPDTCTKCNSQNVEFTSSKAKGYTFIKVVCKKCYATAQMGQYKDGGYFWKKFEEFQKKDDDIPIIEA